MSQYRNPANGYTITGSDPLSPAWCLLFGPLYFLAKGNITHAVLSGLLAFFTCGVTWFIYPLFVFGINDKFYQSRGWVRIK